MATINRQTPQQSKRGPDLTDPKVRAARRAEAERLVRNEEARRRERRFRARTA